MPDNNNALNAIGLILQKWEMNRAKKKEKKETGLQSKLRDPQSSLSNNEKLMLKSQLLEE